MGHWEQIAVENQRHREKRERMDPRWRAIRDFAGTAAVIAAAATLWAITLAPVARWFF